MIFACYKSITTRDVEEATGMRSQIEKVNQLIRRAEDRFDEPIVKRYLEQHILALEKNPSAEFSWDLRLE